MDQVITGVCGSLRFETCTLSGVTRRVSPGTIGPQTSIQIRTQAPSPGIFSLDRISAIATAKGRSGAPGK